MQDDVTDTGGKITADEREADDKYEDTFKRADGRAFRLK